MSASDPYTGLSAFLAVADAGGFTAAAARLGVSPAAASQSIKALETRLGAALFVRTTRRVGLTEAGAALLDRIRPATTEIIAALAATTAASDEPIGLLRLSVPRMAAPLVIEPVIPAFRRLYPRVTVEISIEDGLVDLPARGFDAGIRIGEYIERDMVAVRLTRDIVWSVVGSPAYFAEHGRPERPEDLSGFEAIRYRFPSSGVIYRWEFERDGRAFSVDPPGGVIVNDGALLVSLARAGVGLSYIADIAADDELRAGLLERTLEAFLPTTPGLFLYFPQRAQTQPKLRAFIDVATRILRSTR